MGTVIGEMLKTRRRDRFAIFHPSLAYLAGQYGLEQLAVEYEGKEPSMAHMVRVAEAARSAGIRTVFCQAQVDRHLTEALAHEIGAKVVDIDPLREDLMQNIMDITFKLSTSLHE
jgi:zinc transport system substrate-binding protein